MSPYLLVVFVVLSEEDVVEQLFDRGAGARVLVDAQRDELAGLLVAHAVQHLGTQSGRP